MKWLLLCVLVGAAFAQNPEETEVDPDTFEGDMILTPEQKMAAINGWDVDAPLGRGSIKNRRWPGGVFVYEIDRNLARDSRAMAAINGAFQEWSSKTCITFRKRTNEQGYAYFKPGSGCSSYVGRSGSRQPINLASGCWHVGIVAHEIGHALGFYHEQSRPDRDNFVTIQWDNIIERNKFNFNKYNRGTIDSLGTPYDYGSVMHYGSRAFSKNGRPTIVAKQSGVAFGQRRGLSAIDAQQMNLLYNGECSGGGGGGGGGGSSCADKDRRCPGWTRHCGSNRYVQINCKKTCRKC